MRYDAFISYRHHEFDTFVAENIHKKLENFRLPAYVRKKTGLKKNCRESVFRYAGSMAVVSDQLMRIGRRKDAIYALRSVLRDDSDINLCNSSAVRALYRAMGVYGISDYYMPKCVFEMDGVPFLSCVSFDGKYLCAGDSISLKVFETYNRVIK